MKELNDIVQAYDKAVQQNKQTALATVVKVEGSSYRRPGARMLVTEQGEITGAISGGCLEGDALRKAQYAILQQQNKLEIYDTTDDEDNNLGVQLGCNGIVYILFEPLRKDDSNNPINIFRQIIQQRKDAVIVTSFDVNRNAVQKGTIGYYSSGGFCFDEKITGHCKATLQQRASAVHHAGDESVLYQFIPPVLQLIIVGAGNDVQPLVEISALLGWKIIVADGRRNYATRPRFPKATEIKVVKAAGLLSACSIDTQTAIVLMTHNYNYDLAVLQQLTQQDCTYIGVLGPGKKLFKMTAELGLTDRTKLNNIFGPVGLDIGSETAEEIALSVVAEIKAVFAGRDGASLRDKPSAIHSRNTVAS